MTYRYYEFEVTLIGVEPRIWRRFLLRDGLSFQDLHKAIQDACGWEDYHLFDFSLVSSTKQNGMVIAGIPDEDEAYPDAKKAKLRPYFDKFPTCVYEYDFGDGWEHEVKQVQAQELPYKFKRALLDGARAFPLEDMGGLGGYDRCVEFLKTGHDEWGEPEELSDWLGDWTPESFDLNRVKAKFDK